MPCMHALHVQIGCAGHAQFRTLIVPVIRVIKILTSLESCTFYIAGRDGRGDAASGVTTSTAS